MVTEDPSNPPTPPTPPTRQRPDMAPAEGEVLPAPRAVGPYVIERVIRREESLVVGLGRDTRPGSGRVVLMLVDAGSRPELIEPLQSLAAEVEGLRHRHLARLLEYGRDPSKPDRLYFVWAYTSGRTLRWLIAESGQGLDADRVVAWADQLASAIDYLHDHDLAHGSICPDNVIIDENDAVTLAGGCVGNEIRRVAMKMTEREMLFDQTKPTQLRPGSGDDRPRDIYAFAATLYAAMGGRSQPSLLETAAGEPQRHAPIQGRSVQINMALLSALSVDPGARPVRARELVQELHGAPVRQIFTMPRPPARLRPRINANLVAGVLAMAAIGYGGWLWIRPPLAPGPIPVPGTPAGSATLVRPAQRTQLDGAQPQALTATDQVPVNSPPAVGDAPAPMGTRQSIPESLVRLKGEAYKEGEKAGGLRYRDNPAVAESVRRAKKQFGLAGIQEQGGRYGRAENGYRSALELYRQAVVRDSLTSMLQEVGDRVRGRFQKLRRAAAAAAAATPAHGRTIVNSLGQTLVFIGPGVFLMGSSVAERGRSPGEDQRAVRITKGFWIGVCEVTRGQFEAFVTTTGYTTDAQMEGWSHGLESDGSWQQVKGLIWRDPGFAQTLDHPVVCVSRNDALAFCRWLGGREGRTYHLPTEAQWEYTCRAGSQTAYSWGDEIAREHAPANVADTVWASRFVEADGFALSDAHVYTSPVGTFPANAWGLFDMHGNVQEWCRDHYAPYGARKVVDLQRPPAEEDQADRSPYVLRGGSFASGPAAARSAHRDASPPHARFVTLGFRILLEEQEP